MQKLFKRNEILISDFVSAYKQIKYDPRIILFTESVLKLAEVHLKYCSIVFFSHNDVQFVAYDVLFNRIG